MRTVAIVNQFIPQYRVPAWEALRGSLADRGVRLRLLHGRAHRSYAPRGDTVALAWSEEVPMREVRVAGRDLVYLELGDVMRSSALVITNQEIRLLHNFRLLAQQMRGIGRLALMGHGRDSLKEGRPSASEQVKLWMSARVHWWFAYNERTRREVVGFGYPPERITTFMNSTDTRRLRRARDATTAAALDTLRRELGLGTGPRAIYVGGIDPIKQMGYLIESLRAIRAAIPDFEMLVVGAGAERDALRAATGGEPWIRWIAPQFDEAKARHMLLADLCLMPAGVGLGIVDTFALGVPLVTTDRYPHGVEIEYLEHGVNGWMCRGEPTPAQYGQAVADLLRDPARVAPLRQGALEAGERYSIEAMVDRFTDGILKAIDAPSR